MTSGILRVSALALSVAAFASLSSLSAAVADTSTGGGDTPSLSEPAPTPDVATAPGSATPAMQPPVRSHARHYARHNHYARSGRYDRNPVADVFGGVADLGAMAAYPIYCFPNYGSCPVYRPY
jgi:hypothetical protein